MSSPASLGGGSREPTSPPSPAFPSDLLGGFTDIGLQDFKLRPGRADNDSTGSFNLPKNSESGEVPAEMHPDRAKLLGETNTSPQDIIDVKEGETPTISASSGGTDKHDLSFLTGSNRMVFRHGLGPAEAETAAVSGSAFGAGRAPAQRVGGMRHSSNRRSGRRPSDRRGERRAESQASRPQSPGHSRAPRGTTEEGEIKNDEKTLQLANRSQEGRLSYHDDEDEMAQPTSSTGRGHKSSDDTLESMFSSSQQEYAPSQAARPTLSYSPRVEAEQLKREPSPPIEFGVTEKIVDFDAHHPKIRELFKNRKNPWLAKIKRPRAWDFFDDECQPEEGEKEAATASTESATKTEELAISKAKNVVTQGEIDPDSMDIDQITTEAENTATNFEMDVDTSMSIDSKVPPFDLSKKPSKFKVPPKPTKLSKSDEKDKKATPMTTATGEGLDTLLTDFSQKFWKKNTL
ncbi:hypothetical protein B0T24DRAFT_675873 [Lasiosphaeria ovina]|uniref:Uncharacterized protein n=1 Tax=Lasiosphaeria ovina TaxID=92902 RepID=A0AAE0NEQ6_9PEZI|nr:hypothetical protein B0T24DRAFT_675873 [Lasiosphaeria ovina]